MDINEGTTTEDLWTPYKELVSVVESYLARDGDRAPYAVHIFESVLRRHRLTFLSLLKYPVKNTTSREEIKRGITEGVNLPSVGRTFLSKELVDEAIIISDMYNVNEYLSLELLHTAQRQASRHPGLARGLLAVLLYYDGRRSVLHALRQLMAARDGVSWCVNAREEIIAYVTRYVEHLIQSDLLEQVLEALHNTEISKELELLQNNRALPPAQYHAKLLNTMESIRILLAGTIFAASAQLGLSKSFLLKLLSEMIQSPQLGGGSATGALDEVSLALHMALLYALDLSVLHRREDGEELAKKLPLLAEPELMPALVERLGSEGPPSGVRALCQLALGLALAALKRAPHPPPAPVDLLDQDDLLVDAAIDANVFEYLDEIVLSSELVANEEYYQRRIHSLITDFIVFMHSKLMEMRARAEEAARSAAMFAAEGLRPPPTRAHLDALLRCVHRLYARDVHRLRDDYWAAERASSARHGTRAAALHKFARAGAELASGALAALQLRALASLAVARHTWPLLAAHHLLSALALYYRNLRQDPSPLTNQYQSSSLGATAVITPGARPGRLLVRHEEVEAMIAALQLIAAVAREDSAACTAICENLQWDAVNVMFGLICCHVPIQLKAELCITLAALASTPVTASRVWSAMEAAQLVSASSEKRALTAELLETECQLQEYPLSRAWLRLMGALAQWPPPRSLGAGARPPGLLPYLEHALARLALPAPHRAYAQPDEKYQVLALSLQLFARWLEDYSPAAADFALEAAPPAFLLLLHLHTNSDLLRLLLATLDDTVATLERRTQPSKQHIEDCLLYTLRLIERGLALERALVSEAAAANRSVIVIGLSKLILAESCRERGVVPLCRALALGGAVAARAARALQLLLAHVQPARHLLARADTQLRHYFVECLDAEEWADQGAEDVRQSKESVVAILLQILPTAQPNLAHYLLGFTISENVSQSTLHEAGVAGTPRSCLHALLDMLDARAAPCPAPSAPPAAAGASASAAPSPAPACRLVEASYRLLYALCARDHTATPVLRLLRARDHLLPRHLRAHIDLESADAVSLMARSWLLRACACEAGAAAASRHLAALRALLRALTHADQPAQEWEWCLLRRCVAALPVAVAAAAEPRWELFHAPQLREAILSCDLATGVGGKRISVPRIHALLSRELAALQPSAPQRARVAAEIQKVLDYVTEVNKQRNLAATLTHYYDSWRQLTEIILCVTPPEILDIETKKNLILNILQDLLNKIPPAEVLPQLGNLASGTVLLLLVNLRHCYILQKRETSLKASDFETTFFGPSTQMVQTKSLTLKFILQKILSWLLVSGGSTQKVRVNLYAALLNFLNIVNLKTSTAELDDSNSTYVSRLDSSVARAVNKEDTSLKSMVIDVISSFGSSLCALVCGDCVGSGLEVCRMVALSCLDSLLEIHPHSDWMNTLTDQGYLRSLIDSLLQDDEALKQVLEAAPKSLRALYVYESKMALLVKMAARRAGAESVVREGALAALAALSALGAHPDVLQPPPASAHHHFLPSVADRFRQMLVPALSLCGAVLTALGAHNHSAVLHVMHFLLAHIDCLDVVLRSAHVDSEAGLLQELEGVTSLAARAASPQLFAPPPGSALHASAAALQRLQALLLALLPRFSAPPATLHDPRRDHVHVYYKIVVNLVTFARRSLQSGPSRLMLHPPLAAAIIQLLQEMVHRCHVENKLLATVTHQLQNIHTLTVEELSKLWPQGEEGAQAQGEEEAEGRGARAVRRRAAARRGEAAAALQCAEAALALLWEHLRAALQRPEPRSSADVTLTGAVSAEEVSSFVQNLVGVFNDRFTDQLLEAAKNQPPAQRGLIEVLLKDIKSMIQFAPV